MALLVFKYVSGGKITQSVLSSQICTHAIFADILVFFLDGNTRLFKNQNATLFEALLHLDSPNGRFPPNDQRNGNAAE